MSLNYIIYFFNFKNFKFLIFSESPFSPTHTHTHTQHIKNINVGIYVYLCHSYIPTDKTFIFAYEYMNLALHMPSYLFGFSFQIKYKDFEIGFLNYRNWDSFFGIGRFMD